MENPTVYINHHCFIRSLSNLYSQSKIALQQVLSTQILFYVFIPYMTFVNVEEQTIFLAKHEACRKMLYLQT